MGRTREIRTLNEKNLKKNHEKRKNPLDNPPSKVYNSLVVERNHQGPTNLEITHYKGVFTMTQATIRNRNARNTSNPAKADHLESTQSKEKTTMTNATETRRNQFEAKQAARLAKFVAQEAERLAKFKEQETERTENFEAKQAERETKFQTKLDTVNDKYEKADNARAEKIANMCDEAKAQVATQKYLAWSLKYQNKIDAMIEAHEAKQAKYKTDFEAKYAKRLEKFEATQHARRAKFEAQQNARKDKFEEQEAKRAEKKPTRKPRKSVKPVEVVEVKPVVTEIVETAPVEVTPVEAEVVEAEIIEATPVENALVETKPIELKVVEVKPVKKVLSKEQENAAFLKTLDELLGRNIFQVRIAEMRKELGWDNETFDAVVIRLSDAQRIVLQEEPYGDVTDEDIAGAFYFKRLREKFIDVSR